MDKIKDISLSQLGLYNPQRLNDATVGNLFVVRKKHFQLLIDKISKEKLNSIPQHYLFIGQIGMGKSTLLKRLEVELRKGNSKFIPLLFPEEQYNLNRLSEFWLNSLDAMADVLELLERQDEVKLIDAKVKEFEVIKDEEDLAKQAFQFLMEMSKKINKRAVLLIDNLNFIFDRLDKNEQHTLRAWLMQNDAPILVGASTVEIEDTYNYGAPFYDAFQISYLNKLSFEEFLVVLNNLAKLTNEKEILKDIHQETSRLKTIHQLIGGNPRTAVMLFKIIIKGFSKEINDDLEALLDEITPLYKARFEALSVQMQIIVDAVALHWDPMNLEQLRNETRLENNQLSPQLKRLVELGWIEKIETYKTKGSSYQISERFFNIWFLMRRSSRRQKKELYCLSKFLESFYLEDLDTATIDSLSIGSRSLKNATLNFDEVEVAKAKNLKKQLKDNYQKDFNYEVQESATIYGKSSLVIDLSEGSSMNQKYLSIEKQLLEEIEQNKNSTRAWINLVFLYRDKMNKIVEAEECFSKLEMGETEIESYWLNKALFELYKKNEGIAKHSLEKALYNIEQSLPLSNQYDWWRFGAAVIKLEYGTWFLSILEAKGLETVLAPYYVAIKALTEKNIEGFLNSIAVEIREPARKIMGMMERD